MESIIEINKILDFCLLFSLVNSRFITLWIQGSPREEVIGLGSTKENKEQKSKILLILIILSKNVYILRGLFKGFVKLDKQENIF